MTLQHIGVISLLGAASLMAVGCASTSDAPGDIEIPADRMFCGQAAIDLDYREDSGQLVLTHEGTRYTLAPSRSASGARFTDGDDMDTVFWSKGNSANLTLNGNEFPECLAVGSLSTPFVARGNEPFWHVTLVGRELTLSRMGEATETLYSRVVAQGESGQTIRAEREGLALTLDVAPQLCMDSMSGMPHPNQVRLTVNGETWAGCGGDPERLLRGTEWVVEDIDGGGIIDRSRVTIRFLADNRVVGRSSCNRYMGEWSLTGEGLEFGRMAGTLMACAPALMQQEERFLSVLSEVQRFKIGPHGELILTTADGDALRAVQSSGKP
ncbi:MAG: META domain-containing protein [Marinobacter sp.]|nr:META domain-containing protein [Marinobacter sp.]